LVLSISFVIGGILGIIMAKLQRFGAAILAAFGGFCLGLIIYGAFLYKADDDRQILYWCFNIGMALICGILTIWLFEHMLIISTSIVGSYLFIRGISLYGGHFPGEVSLINEIKINGASAIDPLFYAYMAGFVVSTILCLILQYKYWGERNVTHPYHSNKY